MWWWLLTGFISLSLGLLILYVYFRFNKEEFLDEGELTVGDITKMSLVVVGGVLLGPISTIILILIGLTLLWDSKKVVWSKGDKDE